MVTIQYTRGRCATTAVRRFHNIIIIIIVVGVVTVSVARTDLVPLALRSLIGLVQSVRAAIIDDIVERCIILPMCF